MVNWFWQRGASKRPELPRLRPRGVAESATKVDLHELTPDLQTFLGKAAYLQLMLFENLGTAIATAPTAASKEALSRVASLTLEKHHGLTAELVRHNAVPGDIMEQFAGTFDEYQAATTGRDWFENLVTCQVTAGFLDDFFLRLAPGLPDEARERVTAVLGANSGADILADQIRAQIEASPLLASRLAMWGRRLVGDTMLLARGTLAFSGRHDSDEARIEPVFTELIAAHTRRMDALGLTA